MRNISVTVASIIEQHGKFLVVEEQTDDGVRINQPAGHLEPDESIVAGTIRETLEESAYHFVPQALVGVYRWRYRPNGIVYVRFALCGSVTAHEADRKLDDGILRALWMSADELRACRSTHRSPLVSRCVEDYLAGRRYPLDVLIHTD